jgi:hypothetical protein
MSIRKSLTVFAAAACLYTVPAAVGTTAAVLSAPALHPATVVRSASDTPWG